MPKADPRVDAYIARAAPFAQPILQKLRELVHRATPEMEETIKWGMPFFELEGIVCHMAAFKAHCAFGFWRNGKPDPTGKEDEAMGQFGRLATTADLPADAVVVRLVQEAVARQRSGEKPAPRPRGSRTPIPMPKELAAALRKSPTAKKAFDGFPPSHQREYLEWVTEAKTAATRDKRIATSIEWLAEGKPRMWKYRR